ncbi:hypothetical protein Tco_0011995 [Tanacetum coccineum]
MAADELLDKVYNIAIPDQGTKLFGSILLAEYIRRKVGLSLSCLSLENELAVCEECVPLDAVTGLCFLLFGLFFLSHDSDSENWVCEFRWELSLLSAGRHPELLSGVCLLPLPAVFWTAELAGVWA